MEDAIGGPAQDDDTVPAHLFLCLENGHYGVSSDASGKNLPTEACLSGWRYVKTFKLGVREALPFQANPEPVLRALRSEGYYIQLPNSPPHGTSQ